MGEGTGVRVFLWIIYELNKVNRTPTAHSPEKILMNFCFQTLKTLNRKHKKISPHPGPLPFMVEGIRGGAVSDPSYGSTGHFLFKTEN
jgi:hypothetical protein